MRIIVNIDVPELPPAIDFYRAAFGLTLERMLDGDVAELTGGSSVVYLLAKPVGSRPSRDAPETRRYARHWTPVHMDFVVDDIEAAAERAIAAGATRETDRVEWMGSKCMTFADPFGHGFCLIEFNGDTYESAGSR